MRQSSAALRIHVESALAGRVPSPFRLRETQATSTAPVGIPVFDENFGGLPRGSLTEVYGGVSAGKTSFFLSALAGRTRNAEVCALVDAQDAFDPRGAQAAGVLLDRLLWARCRGVDQALHSTDLLLHGGGFGLIVLDFSDAPVRLVRQIPLNVWFRLRRAVESTPTILLVLSQESNAKTCASLVLRLEKEEAAWSLHSRKNAGRVEHTPACLLDGWRSAAEIVRSRIVSSQKTAEGASRLCEAVKGVHFVLQSDASMGETNQITRDVSRKVLFLEPEKERRQNPG